MPFINILNAVSRPRPNRRLPGLGRESRILFAHLLEPLFLHRLVADHGSRRGLDGARHAVQRAFHVAGEFGRDRGVRIGRGISRGEDWGVGCAVGGVVVRVVIWIVLVRGMPVVGWVVVRGHVGRRWSALIEGLVVRVWRDDGRSFEIEIRVLFRAERSETE